MKILHYLGIGRLPRRPMIDATGGTERVVLEVAKIQVRRGHDVTIASMCDEAWQGSWQGVRLVHLTPYVMAGLRFGRHARLTSFIRSGHFDLLHLHEYRRTSYFADQPTIIQFHNNPLDGLDAAGFAKQAPLYWSQVGRSDRQIAVSDFVKGRLQLAHQAAGPNALPENIVTNYSGVETNLFSQGAQGRRANIRRELGLKETDILYLFSGAIRPEKGVNYLARAFAKLSQEAPQVCLAIAGGGKLWIESGWLGAGPLDATEREVQNLLHPVIERGRAFILGILSPTDIGAYYAAADVFVLPSMFQETFGLVVLEAFSAGLPVIAFRSGGVPELVQDQVNGILVPQGDEEALLISMRQLMVDQELRTRLGAEAVKTAAKFSWEKTVDRLEIICQDVLKGRKLCA